ncbi:MAG: hypothetical protein PHU53_07860 [Thermoplasmata archaeon]|nr:hypothetical protein [Thermoplasmata archaeon]
MDLSIADQDLSVSDSELTAGTPVTVTATVHGDPSVSTSSSEKALVFSDDFGSGTLSKWIKTTWNPCGLLEVSSAVSNTTPYSLHCQSDPGTNTGPYVMKFLDGAYAHSITETMFYLPTKAQSIDKWDIIRVGSSTGTVFSTTNYEFYIALRDDDYSIDLFEYVKDASGVWSYGCLAMDVYELAPQTWNKVSLEITPTDYFLRVGETTVASGERAASTLIHHLLLGDEGGSTGCWGDSYWDDVKAWSVTESQVSEPGLDATCSVEFYLDAVDPANMIGSVDNVFVPAGGQTPVSIEWTPVAGEHQIIAVATNVVPEDRDYSNNQASVSVSVTESGPAEITVQKVKLSGIDEGFTHTYYEWELQITVTNIGGSAAESVTVFDVLPAELELLDIVPSTGSTEYFGPAEEGTRAAPTPDTILPQKSTHITWTVGTLEPGQSETLYMRICTRLNPAGKQEFTSPGTYILNEGAYAVWADSQTGAEIISEPAPAITVEISDYVLNVIENPQVPLPKRWFFMIMSFGCFVPGLARKRKP